jgi:sRNA-binding regulator protein Hfq
MTNRKLIRPDIGDARKSEGPRGVRRKASPPEQTNAEEFYYLKQMQARTPMVLRLVNGEELRGWVEWYDKGAIKFHRHDAPNLLIPKTSILFMFKEEELRRQPRSRWRPECPANRPRPLEPDEEELLLRQRRLSRRLRPRLSRSPRRTGATHELACPHPASGRREFASERMTPR